MNNVDPWAWLTQTLKRIANGWPSSDVEALMPRTTKPERRQLAAYLFPLRYCH